MDRKTGLEKYRKISVFNETTIFIPLNIIIIGTLISSIFFSDQLEKDAIIVVAISMFFCFIPLYILCGYKVKKYNRFLENSLIIQNVSVQDVNFVYARSRYSVSYVNVRYKYIAPNGVEYEGSQKTKLFWNFEPNQSGRWRQMLQNNKDICVLIRKDAFSKSYLPLCEEYCLRYNRMYVVHLFAFLEDYTI